MDWRLGIISGNLPQSPRGNTESGETKRASMNVVEALEMSKLRWAGQFRPLTNQGSIQLGVGARDRLHHCLAIFHVNHEIRGCLP